MLAVEIRRKTVPASGGQRCVIEKLAFRLAADEIVALVGPSGCGKTTLLRIIGGLDSDFSGSLAWQNGQPPLIGTVFQEPQLLPWRTVQQNIALVGAADPGEVAAVLARLGLAACADMYPPALSLGMARRVAIARALAIRPALMLLDEPFVSLDPAMADRARAVLVEAWQARPGAALLVTHDLAEAAALADRIVMLSAGPARVQRIIEVPAASRRRGMAEGTRIVVGFT